MPEVIFNGPEGRIESRYNHNDDKNAPAALILHPHPLHGGTMNNKVVYHTYHTFVDQGFSTLRFNFRGVGRSQGKFDSGVGELCDAATALDWLQLQNPNASTFWIAGFSFGAWIALQLLMRRPEIENFIAISPPTNKYDFSFLAPCPSPGLVIQGDQDSIVSVDSVSSFSEKLSKQKNMELEYKIVPKADHFFRNNLDEMKTAIDEYISLKMINAAKPKPIKRDRRRRQLPTA